MFLKSLFVVVLASAAVSAEVNYRLIDLGNIGGPGETRAADSRAIGLNNTGTVAGWAFVSSEETSHAYVYSFENGGLVDLHTQGLMSQARAINEQGWLAGFVFGDDHRARTSVWHDGRMETLTTPDNVQSIANAISDRNELAGDLIFDGYRHAFRSSHDRIEDLGTLGGRSSSGNAINRHGTIVGSSLTSSPEWQTHAFVSAIHGTMQDLGTLGGEHSEATAISDSGHIVGSAWNESGRSEAFVYSDGVMQGLGSLSGVSSAALGLNERGDIVGWWSQDGFDRRAFLYSQGHMIDLNNLIDPTLGWTLVEATAINDSGQIIGYGLDPQGIDRSFMLNPIPSPAVLPTLFFGFLAFLRRR